MVFVGNSATFMMLDRGHDKRIILNVYSDDGLASTSCEELRKEFMKDFKSKFDVQEKEPDYFLGAAIIQHESGAITLGQMEASMAERWRSYSGAVILPSSYSVLHAVSFNLTA